MHGGVGTAYYTDSGYPAAHSYGHNNYHGAGQSVRKKRPANSGSRYLTDEENTLLFSMLGNDCISLAAGICQLYRADNGHWTRVVTGVIALVKDYNRRAYVLRMYNLDTQTLSWEQILYRLFQANYYPAVPRFLSFEGDQAVYGLSFAEESEATDFGHHLRKRYEAEQKSTKSSTPSANTSQGHRRLSNIEPQRKLDFSTALTVDTTPNQGSSENVKMRVPVSKLTPGSRPTSIFSLASQKLCKSVVFPSDLPSPCSTGSPSPQLVSYFSEQSIETSWKKPAEVTKQPKKVSKHKKSLKQKKKASRQPSKEMPEPSNVRESAETSYHVSTPDLSSMSPLHDGPPLWALPVGETEHVYGHPVVYPVPVSPDGLPTPPCGEIINSVPKVKYDEDHRRSTLESEPIDVRLYNSRNVSECPAEDPQRTPLPGLKKAAVGLLTRIKSGKVNKKTKKHPNKPFTLKDADSLETDKTHLAGSSAAPRPHRGYDTGITNSGAVTHVSSNTARRVDDKKEKKRKKEKKKLRKEDIGIPTNFQHKAHIGWDQDGGFNQQVFGDEPMDDSVRDLLRAAGHNPDSLKPEEIKFVYNFIENYKSGKNAEPAVSIPTHSVPLPDSFSTRTIAVIGNGRPSGQRPLPATPSMHPSNPLPAIPRHEHVPARPPPPPPPASQQPYHHAQPPPPPPPPVAPSNRTASLLPGSSHAPAPVSAAAPPPPPPPPPVSKPFKGTAPPPPPPPPPLPPNLINGGGNTKTESAPKPAAAPSGAPKDLLAEIQAGARLKPVGPPPERSLGKVVGGSTRDNMMEEIRQGANLKHVDQNAVAERRKSVSVQNLDGIAGALARALESRRNRMNQSDSEDEEANDSEWEDD